MTLTDLIFLSYIMIAGEEGIDYWIYVIDPLNMMLIEFIHRN